MRYRMGLNPLFGGSAFRTNGGGNTMREKIGLNPLFGGSAFRTPPDFVFHNNFGLNPLFGGSAFRTGVRVCPCRKAGVLIPFLAGLLFGPSSKDISPPASVLIPFLAGLLFGPGWARYAPPASKS